MAMTSSKGNSMKSLPEARSGASNTNASAYDARDGASEEGSSAGVVVRSRGVLAMMEEQAVLLRGIEASRKKGRLQEGATDSSCDNVRVLIELIQRSMRALLSSACFLAAFASEHDDTPSRAPSLSLSTFSCFGKGGWALGWGQAPHHHLASVHHRCLLSRIPGRP